MMRIARSLAMLWIPTLHVMSGCAQIIGIEDLPDLSDGSIEPRPDADPLRPDARPVDAGIGSPDARVQPDAGQPLDGCEEWTPKPTHFDPCDLPAPSGALNLNLLGTYVYDTDAQTLTDPGGNLIAHASRELFGSPPVVVISVESLLVGNVARLRVVGSKPLLVASWSEIYVEGTIDVSSSLSESGAGANTGTCAPSGAGELSGNGGGGGGGGGFGGDGGRGGAGTSGDNGTSRGNGGNPGGIVSTPATVRGGCPGARGGGGNIGDGSGGGGAGGGAFQLTAQSRATITGRLNAGGSGGEGANSSVGYRAGGGGGGSGGLIGLEAPVLMFGTTAIVAANGGGGGEACERERANSGLSGQDSDAPAEGGSGASSLGGDGGDGSANSTRDGSPGANGVQSGVDRGGGGGGGGGAGYIIIDGTESVANGAVLSPPPSRR